MQMLSFIFLAPTTKSMHVASKFPLWQASISASSKHVSVMAFVEVSSRRSFSSSWSFAAALIISLGINRQLLQALYTAKSAQVGTMLTSCNRLEQQDDIRMRFNSLRQLVDEKSAATCQQTCCKLIVKTCYPHGIGEGQGGGATCPGPQLTWGP